MINFDPSFDVEETRNLTTIKCAEAILGNTIDEIVTQVDLVNIVADLSTATSTESVRGTFGGGDLTPPKHKLRGRPCFKKTWVVCKVGKRVVFVKRTSKKLESFEIVTPTYDTPNKRAAREKGCIWCIRQIDKDIPKVLTLAGPEAVCATMMYDLYPNADIINIDTNAAVLAASSKLGLQMKNIHGDISDYIKSMIGKNTGLLAYDGDDFLDLLNYDTDGYFGEKLVNNLEVINHNILCDYLCVTIQGDENIRNTGAFVAAFKRKYVGVKNPIPIDIVEILTNYELLKHFKYQRSESSRVEMRTMVFKLKINLDIVT